jgi:hypothetical protein
MTKQNQKQLDRAYAQGFTAYLRCLAVIHRSSSTRTQREIDAIIKGDGEFQVDMGDHFVRVNGALLHRSEA